MTAEAKAHFKAGVNHLRSKENELAYREFNAAYAASPTWKILGNLGIAADKLERQGEAIDALQEYLEAGKDELSAREAAQVRGDLERLRAEQATVTLEAPAGPIWIVDIRSAAEGAPVVNRYGPFEGRAELRVRSGKHEFQLDKPGLDAAAWTVTLLAGDTASHSFAMQPDADLVADFDAAESSPALRTSPEEDSSPRSHTPAYVLWGVGAAATGVATVLYLKSHGLQNEADDEFSLHCPLGFDPADSECAGTTASDARAANWRTAALLTGVGAAGALVSGTVLYWLDSRATATLKPETGSDQASVHAWISPTGVGVSGSF